MHTLESEHGPMLAEQYVRMFWRARYQFLLIVALSVGGALVVTALLPKTYISRATVSVRPGPKLMTAGVLFDTVISSGGEFDADRSLQAATRFLRRFQANRTVTLAARDAGIIGENSRIDDRQLALWVELERIPGSDLISVYVNQPTAQRAQLLAQKLIDRTMQLNHEENKETETRKLLDEEIASARREVSAAEAYFLEANHADVAQSPAQRVQADRAALELDLARKSYAAVKRRQDAINLILSEQQVELHIIDPPTLPLRPTFPRPLLNVSIGLILGVLAATALVVVRGVLAGSVPRRQG